MTEPKPPVATMPEPTAPAVAYAVTDAVATLSLSNPLRLNAMTAAMWAAIPAHIATAEADPSVRVIVVRGTGHRAFSAGADISEFAASRTGAAAAHYNDLNHSAFAALEGASKPTIAMIHGPCLGGGLAIVFYVLHQRTGAIVCAAAGVGVMGAGIYMQASGAKLLRSKPQ